MLFVGLWIALSFVVAMFGDDKKIGFVGSLLLSLIVSPVIGLLIVIASAPKEKDQPIIRNDTWEKTFTKTENPEEPKDNSVIAEIERLVKLKDAGHLTDLEFITLKQKLLTPPTSPNQN